MTLRKYLEIYQPHVRFAILKQVSNDDSVYAQSMKSEIKSEKVQKSQCLSAFLRWTFKYRQYNSEFRLNFAEDSNKHKIRNAM